MYSTEELNELLMRKARLRAAIEGNRRACVVQAGEVLRPLAWIDRVMAEWRRVAPLAKAAAVPFGWMLWRKLRLGGAARSAQALRWLPTLLGLVRAVGAMRGH